MLAECVAALGSAVTRPGFDVVATWAVWTCWPFDDWLADMETLAASPPPLG